MRLVFASLVILAAGSSGLTDIVAADKVSNAAKSPLEFNRDVRPILSDHCFRCHGPDPATRKGGLRLDDRDAAIKAGAITPGQPAESLLIERIHTADLDQLMPPPKALKPLSSQQKAVLSQWIQQGAAYQSHWSFLPVPKEVPVPKVDNKAGWIRSPLDAFVLDRLRSRQIVPAVEASREKWLRRVSFDLTGLPPTLEELDAFLADRSETAFEDVVDRLLASPHFGERMANEWVDVARFADTFGYQTDRDMHMWPWRDWVIRAFNDNLPYSQFILWQTAGDLLEKPTRDQYLATAFNRLHRQTNEGGSTEEEYRVEYVSDRVHTNGAAFLGLTFECARCHDHKYDPISQQDYYRLSAFFNNIDESGLYSHFTEAIPTPAMPLYEGDQEAHHLQLRARVELKQAELQRLRQLARISFTDWRTEHADELKSPVVPAAMQSFDFDTVKAAGDYRPVPGKRGQAIEFGGDDAFPAGKTGVMTRVTSGSFAIWVRPTKHRPRMIVFHRSRAAEDSAFRGYSLVLDNGKPQFSLVHFWPGNAIRVQAPPVLPLHEWTHLAVTYDGSSRAAGVKLYINGTLAAVDLLRDQLTRDITHRSEWGDADVNGIQLALGARFRDQGFQGGAVDDFQVFSSELSPLEIAQIAGVSVPQDKAAQFAHYLLRHDAGVIQAAKELQQVGHEENELVTKVRQIMVLRELPQRRPTHLLKRGSYLAPADLVTPGTPGRIWEMPAEFPRNRLGFAQWLIDDRQPLTPRVTVNRFWQMFFGRGLVATPEDFGSQGQPPSHPELLDWLSRDFMQHQWDVKYLCKQIVLSATYRQTSVPRDPQLSVEDPENRLLGRGPQHRLSAEQLRDNALAVSGLLVRKIGGPSVRPYQPAGLWEESGTNKTYAQAHGEGLYRRSLYTFWRRTSPPPSMLSFDAGSREVFCVRRERTATPLQSLVLLNDPQFVEAARVLAQQLLQTHGEQVDARLTAAFRLTTSREPSEKELGVLQRLYRDQRAFFAADPRRATSLLSTGEAARDGKLDPLDHAATAIVVLALLNHDECVTKR